MNRVCFTIGGRPIYWYGVMAAAGFLAGLFHWQWLGRRQNRPSEFAADLMFWILIAGLVGSRLAYVISEWSDFRGRWLHVVRVDEGGLIFYGGLAAAAIAVAVLARRRKEPFWSLADFTISALPLGHALGRIGCFINGCCYGKPTHAPWACYTADAWRHPVQLFESGANLAIYAVILAYWARHKFRSDRNGRICGLYLMLYPPVRFFLEFLRGDPRMRWLGWTVAQWISVGLFGLGIIVWARARSATRRAAQ